MHVPDLVVVYPVVIAKTLLGFTVSVAHKPDLGGIVPGSSGADAREIFHDGLLLRGVRLSRGDHMDAEIAAVIRSNSRSPDSVIGDINAQLGCCRLGARTLETLVAEYGVSLLTGAFAELQLSSERVLRAEISGWPDGEHTAEGAVDNDGVAMDSPVKLRARVRKYGSQLTVDLSESDPQVAGPINLRPQAAETGVTLAVVAMVDPNVRLNAGLQKALNIINPAGRVTHARWPAAVNSYYGMTHVLFSTVLQALAQFNPERAVASGGLGVGAFAIGYRHGWDREPTVQYETLGSSLGGTPEHDGATVVMGLHNHTPNTPVEVLEEEFPVRVTRQEWVLDSCGAGRFRGGPAYLKEYEILGDALLTLRLGHNFKETGWGVFGGEQGLPGSATLIRKGKEIALRPLQTLEVSQGDRVRFIMAAGGGWGDPRTRRRRDVVEDVRSGYISIKHAKEVYGATDDLFEHPGIVHGGGSLD